MAYPFILMIVCVYNTIAGLVTKDKQTEQLGRSSFIALFTAAVLWLLSEVVLWLTH